MLRERIPVPADYVPPFEVPIMDGDPEFNRKLFQEDLEKFRAKKLRQEKNQD